MTTLIIEQQKSYTLQNLGQLSNLSYLITSESSESVENSNESIIFSPSVEDIKRALYALTYCAENISKYSGIDISFIMSWTFISGTVQLFHKPDNSPLILKYMIELKDISLEDQKVICEKIVKVCSEISARNSNTNTRVYNISEHIKRIEDKHRLKSQH